MLGAESAEPSVFPQTEHFLGSVRVAGIQLWSTTEPRTALHLLQVSAAWQVAARQLWLQEVACPVGALFDVLLEEACWPELLCGLLAGGTYA